MKKLLKILCILTILFSTTSFFAQENGKHKNLIETESYNLYKPNNTDAVLLLFGGFPEDALGIENEFPITHLANEKNIAVVYLNYNRKLWLEDKEKSKLAASLQELFSLNNLPTDKIYIGGMSSGGNMALLIGDFLAKNTEYKIEPHGVFIVDSPIDLSGLYRTAESNVKRNFSESAIQEGLWIIETFNEKFGNPNENIEPYEQYSVFTFDTKNFNNLKDLENTKLRFYTEPDKAWWKEYMDADYEQLNAFHIKRLSEFLTKNNFNVEYIPTQNKGFKSNGDRHPHSWSIVDKEELVQWMLEE
ncbi:hypothetical protein BC962_3230 [Gillisia mitskevichiae]|uniref:Alpha/beta hydrolase family protein n=1 Tax=Gillisia mitskevichiae TaxID=270921 RepID=A0A495NWW6_9FLAO|nr:hypothetical protein [Gillisia mitskevichiae]RKS42563.1 hypothetical protein BC962_3230 [Gillisia mitskevichiae]